MTDLPKASIGSMLRVVFNSRQARDFQRGDALGNSYVPYPHCCQISRTIQISERGHLLGSFDPGIWCKEFLFTLIFPLWNASKLSKIARFGAKKSMTARDVIGFYAISSAQTLPSFSRYREDFAQKSWRKKVGFRREKVPIIQCEIS